MDASSVNPAHTGAAWSHVCRSIAEVNWRIVRARISLCLAIVFALAASAASADIQYVYDEIGRLVEVIDGAGNSAKYRYDAAGNIAAIRRIASGQLSVAEFTPNSGPVGTTVTLYGVGFSPTAANNVVKFNGVPATVTSASTTKLVVTVPTGASTGLIGVTVASTTVVSDQSFSVTTGAVIPGPQITGFSPTVGSAGTAVTITGTNFDSTPNRNTVNFELAGATVTTGTTTQLQTTVPVAARSGPIEVRTQYGAATSSADFFVPPGTYTVSQVGVTGRLVVNGSASTFSNIGAGGKIALILFDGVKGQSLALGISSMTYSPTGGVVSVWVKTPAGVDLIAPTAVYGPMNFDWPKLPVTGTYTILVVPASASTLNTTMMLSTDIVGTLVPGQVQTFDNSGRIGRNGWYTFTANAGQRFSIVASAATFQGGFTVYGPDGRWLTQGSFSSTSGSTVDLPNLSLTGTYSVFVSPNQTGTGSVKLQLVSDAAGTLAIDGTPVDVSLATGQNANFTFNGTAGQQLGLGVSNLVVTPSTGYVSVKVYGADKANPIHDCSNFYAPGNECDLPPLPADGAYTVRIDPLTSAATMKLWLSKDLSGVLTQNGQQTFTTARVGQNARYSFDAIAGQDLALTWDVPNFAGSITITKPDNKPYKSGAFSASASAIPIEMFNVPATGTYRVQVNPTGVNVGTVTVKLLKDAIGTVVVGGTATFDLAAGRKADYTFNGTTGQKLGIGISSLATTPPSQYLVVKLIAPDGSSIVNECWHIYAPGNECDLPSLPSAGTYTVRIDPRGSAASGVLWLSGDIQGTLLIGGSSATFSSGLVGQNGRYTFSASAGQNLRLTYTASSLTGNFELRGPDDVVFRNMYFSNSPGSGTFDIANLPATGVYTIVVDPSQTNSGAVTFGLAQTGTTAPTPLTLNGTIPIGAAPTSFSLTSGQVGRFGFAGSVGQRLGLGITSLATTPSGSSIGIKVYAPDGATVIKDCSSYYQSSQGGECDLPPLPSSGTYTVWVNPGVNAASFGLGLWTDAGSSLAVGVQQTFDATGHVGQNGYFTFSGTAGQDLSLLWQDANFTGTISIRKPDGVELTSGSCSTYAVTGSLGMLNLPMTGTYSVIVDPQQISTGAVKLTLISDAGGTLVADTGSLNSTLVAGQRGDFTFEGSVGQRLGLGMSNLVTTPTGKSVTMAVYRPDGTALYDALTIYDANHGDEADLPALPSAGTYTVRIDPGTSAATFTLWLSNDLTGVLARGGQALTSSPARVGQNGRYTFFATAGQDLSLVWSDATLSGAITINKPDSSYMTSNSITASTALRSIELLNVPASGNYTVFVDPQRTDTGSLKLGLLGDAAGTLQIDGDPLSVSQAAGQRGDYAFTGNTGQRLVVGVSNLGTTPSSQPISVSLLAPDGITVLATKSSIYGGYGDKLDIPPLPSDGQYIVRINAGDAAATMILRLHKVVQ